MPLVTKRPVQYTKHLFSCGGWWLYQEFFALQTTNGPDLHSDYGSSTTPSCRHLHSHLLLTQGQALQNSFLADALKFSPGSSLALCVGDTVLGSCLPAISPLSGPLLPNWRPDGFASAPRFRPKSERRGARSLPRRLGYVRVSDSLTCTPELSAEWVWMVVFIKQLQHVGHSTSHVDGHVHWRDVFGR